MLVQVVRGRELQVWAWDVLALLWGAGLQHFRSWWSLALEGSRPLVGAAPASRALIAFAILVAPELDSETFSTSSSPDRVIPSPT